MIVLTVFPVFVSCVNDDPSQAWSLKAGDRLPYFKIAMSDGQTLSTDDLSETLSVITFFDTSCIDCQRELTEIEQAYLNIGNRVRFIAISRAEEAASIAEYWQSEGITMPYSAQANRTVYDSFASEGIPRIYISNSSRTIIAAFGPDDAPDTKTILNIINLYGPK